MRDSGREEEGIENKRGVKGRERGREIERASKRGIQRGGGRESGREGDRGSERKRQGGRGKGELEREREGEEETEREEGKTLPFPLLNCIDSLPACVQYLTGVIHVWITNKSDALKANMQMTYQ